MAFRLAILEARVDPPPPEKPDGVIAPFVVLPPVGGGGMVVVESAQIVEEGITVIVAVSAPECERVNDDSEAVQILEVTSFVLSGSS